jgi:hypothetical protein
VLWDQQDIRELKEHWDPSETPVRKERLEEEAHRVLRVILVPQVIKVHKDILRHKGLKDLKVLQVHRVMLEREVRKAVRVIQVVQVQQEM